MLQKKRLILSRIHEKLQIQRPRRTRASCGWFQQHFTCSFYACEALQGNFLHWQIDDAFLVQGIEQEWAKYGPWKGQIRPSDALCPARGVDSQGSYFPYKNQTWISYVLKSVAQSFWNGISLGIECSTLMKKSQEEWWWNWRWGWIMDAIKSWTYHFWWNWPL